LEDEADAVAADRGELAVAESRQRGPADDDLPESGVSRPASMFSSVDLPEPDGPMMAVKRPASISRLRSFSGRTMASPSP
jgi:hypothetical protein